LDDGIGRRILVGFKVKTCLKAWGSSTHWGLVHTSPSAIQKHTHHAGSNPVPTTNDNYMKEIGELAELHFYLIAYQRGYIISKPFGDNSFYDFILDCKGKLSRVQVKGVSCEEITKEIRIKRYRINTTHQKGNIIPYTKHDIDILAAFLIDINIWYLIPISEIENIKRINLYPNGNGKHKYEKWKENWNLFNHL
jgi:hypothetical protein